MKKILNILGVIFIIFILSGATILTIWSPINKPTSFNDSVRFTKISTATVIDSILTFHNGKMYKLATTTTNAGYTISAYSAGTFPILTATSVPLDFGTTDPIITIDQAGTYQITISAFYNTSGATYTDTAKAQMTLRRTNNTAANIANTNDSCIISIMTTSTQLAGKLVSQIVYTTSNDATHGTNICDILSLYGSVTRTPSAGSVKCRRAWIVAVKLN